jgi:hypothetical protein
MVVPADMGRSVITKVYYIQRGISFAQRKAIQIEDKSANRQNLTGRSVTKKNHATTNPKKDRVDRSVDTTR